MRAARQAATERVALERGIGRGTYANVLKRRLLRRHAFGRSKPNEAPRSSWPTSGENARRALVDRLHESNPANAQVKSRALARHFEAIRRVIADLTRAIAALARKLVALGKRARAFARRIACGFPRRCREPALGNATGHALYASFNVPSHDTS